MTKQIINGIDVWTADDGFGIIGKYADGIVSATQVWLAKNGNIGDFIELPLGARKEYPMKYSTLSIKRELAALGRWDAAKALMQSSSVWDDYILANYLAETDTVFVAAKTAFVDAGIVTAEELAEMLPKCVWTAD